MRKQEDELNIIAVKRGKYYVQAGNLFNGGSIPFWIEVWQVLSDGKFMACAYTKQEDNYGVCGIEGNTEMEAVENAVKELQRQIDEYPTTEQKKWWQFWK